MSPETSRDGTLLFRDTLSVKNKNLFRKILLKIFAFIGAFYLETEWDGPELNLTYKHTHK